MKIFLDDLRNPPDETWDTVRTARDAIKALKTGNVEVLSLDHDLGEHAFGQGITVVNWLEREILLHRNISILPSQVVIHSQNPVGRENMVRALESIYRKLRRNEKWVN